MHYVRSILIFEIDDRRMQSTIKTQDQRRPHSDAPMAYIDGPESYSRGNACRKADGIPVDFLGEVAQTSEMDLNSECDASEARLSYTPWKIPRNHNMVHTGKDVQSPFLKDAIALSA